MSALSTRRLLELMQRLQQLADRRARDERAIAAALKAEKAAAAEEYEAAAKHVHDQHATRRRQLENQFAVANQAAAASFDSHRLAAEAKLAASRKASERTRTDALMVAEHRAKEAEWQALAVFDASKNQPQHLLDEAVKRLKASRRQVEGLLRDARTLVEMRRLETQAGGIDAQLGVSPASPAVPPSAGAESLLQAKVAELHAAVIAMQDQKLASLVLEGGRAYWAMGIVVVVALMLGLLVGALTNFGLVGGAAGLVLGALAACVFAMFVLPRARRQSLDQFRIIRRGSDETLQFEQAALTEAKDASRKLGNEIVRHRDADVSAAQATLRREAAEADRQLADDLAESEAAHGHAIAALQVAHEQALADADATYPPQLEQNAADREREEAEILAARDGRLTTAQAKHDAAWRAMAHAWTAGFRAIDDELAAMHARSGELFPDWTTADLAAWQRPADPPEGIALGHCPLPLAAVKNGLPEHPQLKPPVDRLKLPASLVFDEQPRLVVTAGGRDRRAAAEVLQLAMLRFLTAMPAGKLRFTLIDSAGLGDNFSAFMHLADYDEQLLAGRIWTDSKKIDERLSMIADHMEKVLQKYLRNEFATIQDYNRSAGEVAEPYHVIVAANFPAGFTESAARKLVSIAANGPRCGVFVLTSVDRDLKLPHEFRMDDLLRDSMHLELVGDPLRGEPAKIVWQYPLFEKLPLVLDPLPPPARLTEVLRIAGQQSKAASRVEVPFSLAAPPEGQYWTSDSGRELSVPIGRAGALELQSMRLGVGTAQHALISGKTGSGKSTLLHALITNLALHYGPDQLEFYLVDFKKGVEFKAYATGALPHARVIAIESEREFGVSVLERLDQELRRRGELFRQHGVQDLAGFRRVVPNTPMPRTLLVVDEFQELFVADDKLAQDAALLMDRLVRQGRAFGIHVLLGSQTLAGAYSLARSTIGQMAVRIALECSEADSHLILSDENTAARLLTRPGEAIYNDQNGLVAGNHPFQVVWLPDPDRQEYLSKLRAMPTDRVPTDEPTIVFEGNLPADPRDNAELVAAITHGALAAAATRPPHHSAFPPSDEVRGASFEPTLWLGSAVRIEPATRIVFRRQGGHNLVVVGQSEPMAVGILTSAVLALAGQHGPQGARFTIFDGARPESPERDVWPRVTRMLGKNAAIVPPRDTPQAIAALADEVASRNQSPQDRRPAWYVVIYDLAQFRDLRQTDEDYGFSFASGKPASVDKQFRDILREGPAVGVHVMLWCESLNALTRCIDRMTMRELEFRIAMQMSAADSTSYIDSPTASLLGEHRALLYRDDLGTQTKFRPYGSPGEAWLAEVTGALSRKRDFVPHES